MAAAEYQRRVSFVADLLARGTVRGEILRQTRESFSASTRSTDEYIAAAKVEWQRQARDTAASTRQRTLHRLYALRAKLESAERWSTLVQLERLLVDVEGVRALDPEPTEQAEVPTFDAVIVQVASMVLSVIERLEMEARIGTGQMPAPESISFLAQAAGAVLEAPLIAPRQLPASQAPGVAGHSS